MVLYNISRPVEPPHNYNLNPFTIITETALPGPPSLAGPFSHAIITLQKKSEKFKKSVDNYRPREYNIRVLATIAQLAEHLIRNERVVGSNPISGSKKSRGCRICDSLFLRLKLKAIASNIIHPTAPKSIYFV
jgi:hypothetical protein